MTLICFVLHTELSIYHEINIQINKYKLHTPKESNIHVRNWSFISCEGRLAILRKTFKLTTQFCPSFLEMTRLKFDILWKWLPIRLLWKLRTFWLQIVPKFPTFFIYSRVYNFSVYNLQLLHSISVYVRCCFALPSWTFFKMIPHVILLPNLKMMTKPIVILKMTPPPPTKSPAPNLTLSHK